ncbi:MAG: hypothetical protein RQ752_02835 [Thermohalobaculum sp.]|nr:hypothetical protein [Thermohalobaculum sp.]
MMFKTTLRGLALAAAPAALLLGAAPASAQLEGLNALCIDHFQSNQQPRVPFETRSLSADGKTTTLTTPPPVFPEGNSFGANPANLIPTRYEDAETCRGTPIPNTLPSTPENPYNLHPDPQVTEINRTSPTDDLDAIMDQLEALRDTDGKLGGTAVAELAQDAIDIIEGNPLSNRLPARVYQGFPLLHYLGGLKTKSVDPETKTIEVNQIWYDSHIESDTNYIDPTVVDDEEWTMVVHANVLNRGHEDFAPYAMFFDDPNELDFTDVGGPNMQGRRIPNVGMDQSFFPMEEGLRYTFEIKMPPARFWNLTYNWGWRIHPPRVQVVENVDVPLANGMPRNSAEIGVFGANPRESEEAKLKAIGMIGEMAPAKRMWTMFRALREAGQSDKAVRGKLSSLMPDIRQAFYDWGNRNQLPTGFEMDPDADMTVLFLNNTIYGQVRGHDGDAQVTLEKAWTKRGDQVKIQLLNGDYYMHAYVLVDFGGLRGWENTFHNTLPLGGAGPLFTFGRNYFWIHIAGGGPIPVPPATPPARTELAAAALGHGLFSDDHPDQANPRGDYQFESWGGLMKQVAQAKTAEGIGAHNLIVNLTYEPSRRLRMYQFDALHHDVAVWSVH